MGGRALEDITTSHSLPPFFLPFPTLVARRDGGRGRGAAASYHIHTHCTAPLRSTAPTSLSPPFLTFLPAATGEMADAGEVLLAIYGRIEALGPAAAAGLAEVFGVAVREYVYCQDCDLSSHETSYTQYFYNTQVGLCLCAPAGTLICTFAWKCVG